MEKLNFKITIDAPRERVWEILWGDETYPVWTAIFSEGSRAETDWKKGSKVLFLNGENEGMVSLIADSIPNEFMSFKHLAMVKDGVEDMESEFTKEWTGAVENYYLKDIAGKTELLIEMDTVISSKDYFNGAWPKALAKLKALSESKDL